ncbi:MAG: type III pantothenate kinase [Desulfovibrio sp.]|nr:type III pantothenate kinase [Desulfovibrio sp.]
MPFFFLADIGNTSLKIAIADETSIKASYSLPTKLPHSEDSLGLMFPAMLADAGLTKDMLARSAVCSVVPEMTGIFCRACRRYLGVETAVFPDDFPPLIENRYSRPSEVGADRLMAAFAARTLYPEPASLISVDFGTATTFDCVSGNAYLGGVICPGVMSSYGALASGTAKLPHISFDTADSDDIEIGRDTVTSMRQGFRFGFIAMTSGLCARLSAKLPAPCVTVATGGFAETVAVSGSGIDFVRRDLVSEGLRLATLRL